MTKPIVKSEEVSEFVSLLEVYIQSKKEKEKFKHPPLVNDQYYQQAKRAAFVKTSKDLQTLTEKVNEILLDFVVDYLEYRED